MTTDNTTTADVLLDVQNLVKHFPVRQGILQRVVGWVKAVDGVSFQIHEGETFGLVGESGCGKTTVGRSILRLIEPTSGHVYFENRDVASLSKPELKAMRKDMQIIFQDPFSSLDPRMPIGASIEEGLNVHGIKGGAAEKILRQSLSDVGLHPEHARRYPHEFSGGQRQRIGIARALALRPKLIVCDEPVSALDVSIQSQVLNMLNDLQREYGLTYLFIAHNLSVVEHISDRVGVMYLGRLVELADRRELFENPLHPYTKALISAIPIPDPTLKRDRILLQGDVPSPLNPPSGCNFHPRCPIAIDYCSHNDPQLRQIGDKPHFVACHLVEDPTGRVGIPSTEMDTLRRPVVQETTLTPGVESNH
jgi:peptide/nickel transport system ATP-binding protein/oligopeptide transport system ATP-binding protein